MDKRTSKQLKWVGQNDFGNKIPFHVDQVQWNINLRKIVATTDFLVHKLFDLRKIF